MKRQAKLALVFLAIAVGGLIAFAGAEPETFKTLGDVYADPDAYEGRRVALKSTVQEGSVNLSSEPMRFALEEEGLTLPVEWASVKPVPNHEAGGSLDGRTVVVEGRLATQDGALVFLAEDMKVGCASKYEANMTGNETGNATDPYAAGESAA